LRLLTFLGLGSQIITELAQIVCGYLRVSVCHPVATPAPEA